MLSSNHYHDDDRQKIPYWPLFSRPLLTKIGEKNIERAYENKGRLKRGQRKLGPTKKGPTKIRAENLEKR